MWLFDFGGTERRVASVRSSASALLRELPALHPVERAVVLVQANLVLASVARNHDVRMASDPARVSSKVADAAMKEVLAFRDSLRVVEREGEKPVRRMAACQRRACEVVAATIACGLAPSMHKVAVTLWRAVWPSRDRVEDAVVWIRRRERELGVAQIPPGPDGKPLTDPDLVLAGARVPAFLKRRQGGGSA